MTKRVLDKQFGGYVSVHDNPRQIMELAVEGSGKKPHGIATTQASSVRHYFPNASGWADALPSYDQPWEEGRRKMQAVLDELSRELPAPKSRRRRMRWNEDSGDIDIDRAMQGEAECYRRPHRDTSHGAVGIALLCNLDGSAGESTFWRGAAAIAAADVLEAAGYSCEIWMWCRGYGVYRRPHDKQLDICCVKKAGDPIDAGALAKSLSPFMLGLGIFGSFAAHKETTGSIGGATYSLDELCMSYMDIPDNVVPYKVDVVWNREGAKKAATKALEYFKSQSGDYTHEERDSGRCRFKTAYSYDLTGIKRLLTQRGITCGDVESNGYGTYTMVANASAARITAINQEGECIATYGVEWEAC